MFALRTSLSDLLKHINAEKGGFIHGKQQKETAAILLISAIVLGGGGYTAYQLNAAPASQSVKKSSTPSKQWRTPSKKVEQKQKNTKAFL